MFYDKTKTIGAAVGVIVAIFLIGQQTGIFIFLTGLMSSLVDNSSAQVWVVGSNVKDVNNLSALDIRKGNEIRSIKGVKEVYPLVISGSTMKLQNGKITPVRLIGSEAPDFVGGPWNVVNGKTSDLVNYRSVAADKFDLRNLGDINVGDRVEIGGKMVIIKAITSGARGFGANYIFTDISLAAELGNFPDYKVSAFLVNIKKGYSPNGVTGRINSTFTGIKAWTKKDFSKSTVKEILKDGGIGQSIGSLILFALVAGSVIIGLTLYSAAIDRLSDYATMKAIGANRKYVTRLILLQAFIIAIAGFVIGALLIVGFKYGVKNSGLRFSFSTLMWIIFFALTLIISITGAYFASRNIRNVEPSKVF